MPSIWCSRACAPTLKHDRKRPLLRHAAAARLPAIRARLFPLLHLPWRECGDLPVSRTGCRHHGGRPRPSYLGLLPVLRRLPADPRRHARPLRAASRAGRAAGDGRDRLGAVWPQPLAGRTDRGARADRPRIRGRPDGRDQGDHALVSAGTLGTDHRLPHDGGWPGLDGGDAADPVVALGHQLAGPVLLAGRPLPRRLGDPVHRRARARRSRTAGHLARPVPHHRHRADQRLLLAHPAAAHLPADGLHRRDHAVDRALAARCRRYRQSRGPCRHPALHDGSDDRGLRAERCAGRRLPPHRRQRLRLGQSRQRSVHPGLRLDRLPAIFPSGRGLAAVRLPRRLSDPVHAGCSPARSRRNMPAGSAPVRTSWSSR